MLNKAEYSVLTCLIYNNNITTQRQLAEKTDLALGSVNKLCRVLADKGYISGTAVTEKGLKALEPYRVKRAIFLAAGFGSRLVPITLNTPKPLVKVHGRRMIETLLDAVVEAQIPEIVIVRGYLSEQFDILKNKYPQIQFVENSMYNEANNISSAYLVRDIMQNSYVMEADLVLNNPKLITPYQYKSNYLGVKTDVTDDWCFKTVNGRIVKMTVGGTDCYHMFGISYWDAEDGEKLCGHIKEVIEMPGGKERYWDQVALEYFIKDYKIEIRPCSFDEIVEIDSFSDLKKIDKIYDC